MTGLDALDEIERRIAAACRAGNEDVIRHAAVAITCAGLDEVLPDCAYVIRDLAPDLWCEKCDCPIPSQMCDHGYVSAVKRREYRDTPPRRVALLRGKAADLHKVLIVDGAGATLLLRNALEEWAEDYELVVEVRLRSKALGG